jgi:NhaA family Na+:H+ antiporter
MSAHVPTKSHVPAPPEVSPRARSAARVVGGAIERILHVEATSGIALIAMAAVALVVANSRWVGDYEHLLHTELFLGAGTWRAGASVHFVVNEVLMTIFFFVVGLEIRREIHGGELADLRRASLPIAAAIGGMVVPAAVYLALLPPAEVRSGWGVPMATDIAFAIGVLALLGKRLPPALRVLLLALAIIDDIGAIIVIAVFYSSSIDLAALPFAAGGIAATLVLQRIGVRRAILYVPGGVLVWYGLLRAGLHPTLAGVAMGLVTPARAWYGKDGAIDAAKSVVDQADGAASTSQVEASIERLGEARREAVSPATRLQSLLHPWVAFGVMPLFALANAGVTIHLDALKEPAARGALVGVAAGLVVGKPLGVLVASFIAVRSGVSALPRGVGWSGIALVGMVAGIGFTMAIFVAGLAFSDAQHLGAAKLGVLGASVLAAVLGLAFGWLTLPRENSGARSASEAESSTEA